MTKPSNEKEKMVVQSRHLPEEDSSARHQVSADKTPDLAKTEQEESPPKDTRTKQEESDDSVGHGKKNQEKAGEQETPPASEPKDSAKPNKPEPPKKDTAARDPEAGKDLSPAEIKEMQEKKEKERKQIKGKRFSFSKIGIGQERAYFIENLAMLLTSGMNLVASLESIKAGLKSKVMKRVVEELKTEIDGGSPVWKALDNTGLFSAHALSLIKIGEDSGRLPANLKVISTQDQKERIFKSKIGSALMYPVVVLFFTMVVGLSIAWFILPKLSGVFTSLNMQLPATTKALLGFGEFLGKHGATFVPAVFVFLLIVFYFVFIHRRTRFIGQKIIFSIPGIRSLIQQIELSKFGFILGSLLEAGMPLVKALESLEEVSSFFSYKKFYIYLKINIEEGNSFRKSFTSYPHCERLIPYPVQQMIVASEQSGSLKETLLEIGSNFEEKTDISTKNLSVVLEPILLFVIWIVVIFVALSVVMPIYSLIGGINE